MKYTNDSSPQSYGESSAQVSPATINTFYTPDEVRKSAPLVSYSSAPTPTFPIGQGRPASQSRTTCGSYASTPQRAALTNIGTVTPSRALESFVKPLQADDVFSPSAARSCNGVNNHKYASLHGYHDATDINQLGNDVCQLSVNNHSYTKLPVITSEELVGSATKNSTASVISNEAASQCIYFDKSETLGSRFLEVIRLDIEYTDLEKFLLRSVPSLHHAAYMRPGKKENQHFFVFHDDRFALVAHRELQQFAMSMPLAVEIGVATPEKYNHEAKSKAYNVNGFESTIILHVECNASTDRKTIDDHVYNALDFYGQLKKLIVTPISDTRRDYHVEFFSTEHALNVLGVFNTITAMPSMITMKAQKYLDTPTFHVPIPRGLLNQPPMLDYYNGPDESGNTIKAEEIKQGLDVRTTVMLRNIPNRVNSNDLKHFVDEACRFKYDFIYLRIDFVNDCNVGYAFINFTKPDYVLDFFRFAQGYSWEKYGTCKRAALCYATTQGKESLIDRFRNSAVSQQFPWKRPKLYVSQDDLTNYQQDHPEKKIRVGDSIGFPQPNNWNKLQRSVDNAETNGLYNSVGKKQGRKLAENGQFDRGNPHNIAMNQAIIPFGGMNTMPPMGYSVAFVPNHQLAMMNTQPNSPMNPLAPLTPITPVNSMMGWATNHQQSSVINGCQRSLSYNSQQPQILTNGNGFNTQSLTSPLAAPFHNGMDDYRMLQCSQSSNGPNTATVNPGFF
jgi:hypothetical protein